MNCALLRDRRSSSCGFLQQLPTITPDAARVTESERQVTRITRSPRYAKLSACCFINADARNGLPFPICSDNRFAVGGLLRPWASMACASTLRWGFVLIGR